MTRPDRFDDLPLDMVVHSMPAPQDLATAPQRTRSGRLKMLLVLLVCAAPVLGSYLMYYVVRPEGRTNFGALVQPQRPLPAVSGQTLDGRSIAMQQLRGQWLLISVSAGGCDAECEAALFLQRQLRAGLGKDKDRLDWVWLIDDAAPVPAAMLPRLADATVLRVPQPDIAAWLVSQPRVPLHGTLYLVDPLGNYMMHFAASGLQPDSPQDARLQYAKKVKRDVERLLRASASWDTAGR